MDSIFVILVAVAIVLFGFILGTLIFWGLGVLIVNVFNISCTWTLLHGVIAQFLFILLKQIFGRK